MKEKQIHDVSGLLLNHSFKVSVCCGVRSCFDIMAKGDNMILIIKVLNNIEGFTKANSLDILWISKLLDAIPILIGDRMKSCELSDHVIYTRYSVHAMTCRTLESIFDSSRPVIRSIRGNYCVDVLPGALSAMRYELGMSLEKLAAELGISKQTLYRCEHSDRITIDMLDKLVSLFKDNMGEDMFESFIKAYEIGDIRPDKDELKKYFILPSEIPAKQENIDRMDLKTEIAAELKDIGFFAMPTNAPFDVFAKERISLLTIINTDKRILKRKIEVVLNISEMIGSYSMCITEHRDKNIDERVIYVTSSDLKEFKSAKDLIESVL